MAVVKSLGIGEGRKSAGLLTYRAVRGRTIASRRITENKSNTAKQQIARSNFKGANKAMLFLLSWIQTLYEKSKFGSARNNFIKLNPNIQEWGDLTLVQEMELASRSVGNYIAAMMSTDDPSIPASFNFAAKGSAGGVIVASGEKVTEEIVSGFSEYALYKGVTFTFPSPVKLSDVKVAVVEYPVAVGASSTLRIESAFNIAKSPLSWRQIDIQTSGEGDNEVIERVDMYGTGTSQPLTVTTVVVASLIIKDKIVTNPYIVANVKAEP